MLIFSDIHLNDNKERTKSIINDLKEIIKKHPNENVVLNGDFIDYPNRLSTTLLNNVMEVLSLFQEKIYWISGQHDLYEPNKNAFYKLPLVFKRLKTITNHIGYLEGFYLVPFRREVKDYRLLLDALKNKDCNKIITHIPVREAIISGDERYISCEEFNDFDLVIGGDIHNGKKYGKIQYIGCFAHSSFKDDGCPNRYGWVDKSGFLWITNIDCYYYQIIRKKNDKIITPENITNIKNETSIDIPNKDYYASYSKKNKQKIFIEKSIKLSGKPKECLEKYCNEKKINDNKKNIMTKYISD